jgi:peroxiredoxin Q/BCP
MATSIIVGDRLPAFTLNDQHGKPFSVGPLIGKKPLVVYFYPKDETKVCTAQACSFRDRYEEFQDLGCEVIGISGDSAEKHAKFAENHSLPFVLLSDPDKQVRKLLGVPRDMLGLVPGRYTYVVGADGEVKSVFHDAFSAMPHIEAALEALRVEV